MVPVTVEVAVLNPGDAREALERGSPAAKTVVPPVIVAKESEKPSNEHGNEHQNDKHSERADNEHADSDVP